MAQDPNTSFASFVMSLAATAAVHLGDLGDPMTGQTHVDVPSAGHIIDLLAMLQQKTTNNLDPEEAQLLDQVIYELRLRYVEVSKHAPAAGAEEKRIITPAGDDQRIITPNEPRIIVP
jgi:hypothetical protein